MVTIDPRKIRFKAVRASGPGGSRRNRRATKVQVRVKLSDLALDGKELRRLKSVLEKRVTHRGEVEVQSESSRSQELNRDDAVRKLAALVAQALKVRRQRIPTEPRRGTEERRIREKKLVSEKKQARRGRYS
jgi:ribosome-associated protein